MCYLPGKVYWWWVLFKRETNLNHVDLSELSLTLMNLIRNRTSYVICGCMVRIKFVLTNFYTWLYERLFYNVIGSKRSFIIPPPFTYPYFHFLLMVLRLLTPLTHYACTPPHNTLRYIIQIKTNSICKEFSYLLI